MTLIEISDEQAAVLQAKAAACGLTLEAWLRELADTPRESDLPTAANRHIADLISDNMQDVSPAVMAEMPRDGASQHDHYIYGWPKREA